MIPKPVEFGQDKVQRFPAKTGAYLEAQREAAALAAAKARETHEAALAEGTSDAVVRPSGETAALTESVSHSLGPPLSPFKGEDPKDAARALDKQVAKHNNRVTDFAEGNDENAGKKIEGSGFLQIPYFLWLGIILGLLAFLWIAGRIALQILAAANPPVGVGLQVASMGGRMLSRAFSEVLKGGEAFKERVQREIDDPALREKVLHIFRSEHEKKQSADTQRVVGDLTK